MATRLIFLWLAAAGALSAQTAPQAFTRVEAGLEEAVNWKWDQSPSRGTLWGVPQPVAETSQAAPSSPILEGNIYIVKRGDAPIKIARRYGITVDQLKYANDLTGNLIRVGDELRIPSPEEIARMPAPTPPQAESSAVAPQVGPRLPPGVDREILLFQIFLDRRNFSPGPINGQMSLGFQKLIFLYQHEVQEQPDLDLLRATASDDVGELFTSYTLRPEDFAFIDRTARKGRTSPDYASMISAPLLLYRSAWEFVAERFHSDEKFLRALNPAIKADPVAGTSFLVPNVVPFEIESAVEEPIQPRADPESPITAAIVDLARLKIYRNEKLLAIFPVSSARPALRGRGTWTILDAIPKPRLATIREPRVAPKTFSMPGEEEAPKYLSQPEFLPPGPRNPVGILWINLAREGDDEPLPFGLHGTSIPDLMATRESIGGFRLTNWDIARAARMLPEGTPLRWSQGPAAPVRPPAR